MLNSFTFNGRTSTEFGIKVERMPSLNRSARKFRVASVSGHNGNIYEMEDAWEEIIQPYQIFAGSSAQGAAVSSFAAIMEWLHSASDYAVLYDTYDTEHYRKAIFVDSVDIESDWHTLGRATINFRCRPEHYLVQDPVEVESGDTITNATNHVAHPLITLTGAGTRSLLQIEGRTMSSRQYEWSTEALYDEVANRDTTAWMVDVQWRNPVRLAGSVDGTLNTLDDADGIIEYTPISNKQYYGIGIIKDVQPNSDYTISCEIKKLTTSAWGYINVYFLGSTGWNSPISMIKEQFLVNQEWTPCSVSFRTPSECGYILIAIANTENSTTKREIRKLMFNGGTTAKAFRGFATPSASKLTINSTSLGFSVSGFDSAVIDCERENFSIDGVTANQEASVVDSYGNLSAEYLQLAKGENTITSSGDITAIEIDPRFWEL